MAQFAREKAVVHGYMVSGEVGCVLVLNVVDMDEYTQLADLATFTQMKTWRIHHLPGDVKDQMTAPNAAGILLMTKPETNVSQSSIAAIWNDGAHGSVSTRVRCGAGAAG